MAAIKPGGYFQNRTDHTALIDRLNSAGAVLLPDAIGSLRGPGGKRSPGDLPVTAQGGMVVRLGPGICYVPGPSNISGNYTIPNDGNIDYTVPAANATLARKDLIVCQVKDSFYSGATNDDDFIYLTGTAATTPVDPTLPAGATYQLIARINVGINASSIIQNNIEYLCPMIPRAGGVQHVGLVASNGDIINGIEVGQSRRHPLYGLQWWDGTTWQADAGSPIPSRLALVGPVWTHYAVTAGGYENVYVTQNSRDVQIRGLMRVTGNVALNDQYTIVAVGGLPAAARPAASGGVALRHIDCMTTTSARERVDIKADGSITIGPFSRAYTAPWLAEWNLSYNVDGQP